ncbi:hypothetical protein Moror_13002 [Moniliophthora roreri MCA 2997]|uniref:Uncharacterized protein n=1 Tax=Moniliophthora roreri (strain MCA 2997) TaxID=1381753 RepID=V2XN05_MONRO|nr:hypothetical protein Moror_13002 [Moniliophthora roreri MCA 2997]
MLSRFTSALRFGHRNDEQDSVAGSSRGEVIGHVLEQHPNLSVFHPESESHNITTNEPSSPSKRRNVLKRISKGPEESLRAPSPAPSKLSIGRGKKAKPPIPFSDNHSQLSLGRATPEPSPLSPVEPTRRPSHDALRSNPTTKGPFGSLRSRRSIDLLAQTNDADNALSPGAAGSVRSILREPNTPGTGRNVRFFSRDAYKVMTPDQSSTDIDYQPLPSPLPPPKDDPPSVVTRAASSPKNSRPTLAEVFTPLESEAPPSSAASKDEPASMVISDAPTNTSNLLDFSQDIKLPVLPPGLGFDIDFDSALELPMSEDDKPPSSGVAMTSTPYRDTRKAKGKEREVILEDEPFHVDESIFHSTEKSLKASPGLHGRSQSLSMGQTAYFSMTNGSDRSSRSSIVPSLVSDVKTFSTDSPSQSSIRSRSRALSDTVFHSVLRGSPSKPPVEADINDESSSEIVVYSAKGPEPDPFSANARTYYTPQTMIPTTPPRGAPTHVRKTSKEDSLIVSLQTQLALQTELCGQYETDLRARDELVELLSQKMSELEKEEVKRKGVLRAWKKKVQELERACRLLEEEVEGSRQESMERSLMDEASGEALRMLHRQIANLEREKGDMSRREEVLREEVETLEVLVKERSEDILNLKEKLWKQDESQRELQEGIRQANEQMEMLGNVSIGMIDEDELKRHMAEAELKNEEEKQRHHEAEGEWEKQRTELILTAENAKAERISLEGELEALKQQLKSRDDELATLKSELEAQWGHAEKATDRIEALSAEKDEVEKERHALELERNTLQKDVQTLQADKATLQERCQELEDEKGELEKEYQDLNGALEEFRERMEGMEIDFNDSENRRNELERQVEEFWQTKQFLEEQVQSSKDSVRYGREQAESFAHKLQEREARLTELEMEHRFSQDNIARLEKNLAQRDEEISELSARVISQEKELEKVGENMTKMSREHTRIVNDMTRSLQEKAMTEGEAKSELENLLRRQGEVNVELKTSRDKLASLEQEAERLRRQVHTLQQDSADKDIKIVQLTRQHEQDKEDMNGMNIALDAKQQELDYIKRKLAVRGGPTSTPAPQPKIGLQRRDSAMSSTPSTSRPPSVISDSGRESVASNKERKLSLETPVKIPALAKSTRANATTSALSASTSKPKPGTMGPPPAPANRPSVGTPTPTQRISSLSRSSSATPTVSRREPPTSVQHRRTSSNFIDASKIRAAATAKSSALTRESPVSSELSEKDEKENVSVRAKRANPLPTPA